MKKSKIVHFLLAVLLLEIVFFQACKKAEEQAVNEEPVCAITSPSQGQEFTVGETITISINASDNDGSISEVSVLINNVEKASLTNSPYSYQWNTNGENQGSHSLKVVCIDNQGAVAEDEITVNLKQEESPFDTYTDPRNGKIYVTVTIGEQTWFAENLDFDTAGSFRNPNSMGYGRYYTLRSAKLACPAGWKLPSDEEWKELEMSMHMTKDEADQIGWRGGAQGMWLKSKEGWYDQGNGTDRYGFNLFPAGYKGQEGDLFRYGEEALLWTSTSSGSGDQMDGWYRRLSAGHTGIGRHRAGADAGLSVRCLKE
jgi:uncharacterized protein (TIGR02145 family)